MCIRDSLNGGRNRASLPDAELGKDDVEEVLDPDRPGDPTERIGRPPELFSTDLEPPIRPVSYTHLTLPTSDLV